MPSAIRGKRATTSARAARRRCPATKSPTGAWRKPAPNCSARWRSSGNHSTAGAPAITGAAARAPRKRQADPFFTSSGRKHFAGSGSRRQCRSSLLEKENAARRRVSGNEAEAVLREALRANQPGKIRSDQARTQAHTQEDAARRTVARSAEEEARGPKCWRAKIEIWKPAAAALLGELSLLGRHKGPMSPILNRYLPYLVALVVLTYAASRIL
jgi:hypothetical protein